MDAGWQDPDDRHRVRSFARRGGDERGRSRQSSVTAIPKAT